MMLDLCCHYNFAFYIELTFRKMVLNTQPHLHLLCCAGCCMGIKCDRDCCLYWLRLSHHRQVVKSWIVKPGAPVKNRALFD